MLCLQEQIFRMRLILFMEMLTANLAAPGNGAMAFLFQIQHLRRAVPEQYR